MFNPSQIPSWVSVNQDGRGGSSNKYDRAVKFLRQRNAELKAQGQEPVEITEAEVKELYIKFGGPIVDVPEEEEPQEIEAPKRRGRKAE